MRIAALAFHDVVADGEASSARSDPFYRLTAAQLEDVLRRLRHLAYQTISSRQFRHWQAEGGALPRRSVMLTFDDGYASHFDAVAPLLLRYRFSGTFFIPIDKIGRPGYMTWEQLRKLVFLGMEIGSHGVSHPSLEALSRDELAREMYESKAILESQLGVPVRAWSAPGGFWSRAAAKAARDAGYEAAWISATGLNHDRTTPWSLRRIPVHWPYSAERILALVEGWQPLVWWTAHQQWLARVVKSLIGVDNYERLKHRLLSHA